MYMEKNTYKAPKQFFFFIILQFTVKAFHTLTKKRDEQFKSAIIHESQVLDILTSQFPHLFQYAALYMNIKPFHITAKICEKDF